MTVHDRSVQPPADIEMERARVFLERGRAKANGKLCSHVLGSWQRCLDAGMNPLDRPRQFVVDSASYGHVLAKHHVLRSLARAELELLFSQVSGSNYLLALGSPEGIVMDVMADTEFQDTEAGRTIISGSIWNEAVRGTNAMGLAIHDLAPRSVWQGEHFFRSQGGVSCIAVPIMDSYGALAGVLDASTGRQDWHPHTVGLLNMSAANIEAGLFHGQQHAQTILRLHPRAEYLQTVSAGLIALDDNGFVVSINRRAREILGIGDMVYPADLREFFCDANDEILTKLPAETVFAGRSRLNGTVFLSCSHCKLRRPHAVAGEAARSFLLASKPERAIEGPVFLDAQISRQLDTLSKVTGGYLPILIRGEGGSGKSTMARHLHALITGAGTEEFYHVNCAGVYDSVTLQTLLNKVRFGLGMESQGAEQKASSARSLFLESVDELSELAQGALLRILDEWEQNRHNVRSHVQIISSFCENVSDASCSHSLRNALFFRLASFCLYIPSLQNRTDIDRIASSLLGTAAGGKTLAPEAFHILSTHDWPGNIRELRGTLKLASALAERGVISREDVLTALHMRDASQNMQIEFPELRLGPCEVCRGKSLRHSRCQTIRQTYVDEGRNVSKTARKLGIARSTVYEHIRGLRDV